MTAEVRLYDHLFTEEIPSSVDDGQSWTDQLNSKSREVYRDCQLEPSLQNAAVGDRFQFERTGYFCVDPDATANTPVFNRTVTLRDSWAKMERKNKSTKQ